MLGDGGIAPKRWRLTGSVPHVERGEGGVPTVSAQGHDERVLAGGEI